MSPAYEPSITLIAANDTPATKTFFMASPQAFSAPADARAVIGLENIFCLGWRKLIQFVRRCIKRSARTEFFSDVCLFGHVSRLKVRYYFCDEISPGPVVCTENLNARDDRDEP